MFFPDRSRLARIFFLVPVLLLPVACPRKSSDKVSGNYEATSADVALDGQGNGVILFSTDNTYAKSRDLYLVTYSKDHSFGLPQRYVDGLLCHQPRIVLAPGDVHHSVCLANVSSNETLEETHLFGFWTDLHGGALSQVELDPGPIAFGEFDLAGDAAGNAIVVWQNGGSVLASFGAAGASFAPAEVLHVAVGTVVAASPKVALNAAGDGAIAYRIADGEFTDSLVAHRISAGSIGPAEVLGTVHRGEFSRPAIASDGTLLVAWESKDANHNDEVVACRGSIEGGWGAVEVVASMYFLYGIAATLDATAVATVIWDDRDVIYSSRAPPGGSFGAATPTGLSSFTANEFECAVEPAGRVTLAAVPPVGGPLDDAAATRLLPGRGFGPVRQLPEFASDQAGGSVGVVADASGLTLAIWVVKGGVHAYVWGDPESKLYYSPAAPKAGESTLLDGSGSESHSPAAPLEHYEWDLDGDGAFDVDSRFFTHVFATPGTYPVRLLVTDAWGDTSEVTVDVDVQSGGGGGGPPWKLLVLKTGGGTGYVWSDLDSDGDGNRDIDCGLDCFEFYADGPAPDDHAQVYLTPFADPGGSVFSHWEGLDPAYFDGDYGVDGCLVQVSANRTITAVFE